MPHFVEAITGWFIRYGEDIIFWISMQIFAEEMKCAEFIEWIKTSTSNLSIQTSSKQFWTTSTRGYDVMDLHGNETTAMAVVAGKTRMQFNFAHAHFHSRVRQYSHNVKFTKQLYLTCRWAFLRMPWSVSWEKGFIFGVWICSIK